MPSARARRHPDLTCRPMAVDDEANAIVELDGDDAAFEIRFEPFDLVQRHLERMERAIGQGVEPTFVERIGHGARSRAPRSVPGRRAPDLALQIARRAAAGALWLGR